MNKILILASNPRLDLKLEREIRDLKKALGRAKEERPFEVEFEIAVRPQDLQGLFLRHKPRIVHFCGHGAGEQGLVFQDDEGREQFVSTEALSDLFKIFKQNVECALLNACNTDQQAEAIVEYIDYVIGISQEILDQAAYIFAVGFYQGLAYGTSIERSYELGCNAIQIQLWTAKISRAERSTEYRKLEWIDPSEQNAVPEHLKPVLRKKSTLSTASEAARLERTVHDQQSSTQPTVPPSFIEAIAQEVDRKQYKDGARETLDRFGEVCKSDRPFLTQHEDRQRQILLRKVKDFWIEGFLKKSLYADTVINLDLKNRPDTVLRPFEGIEELPVELDESFEELKETDIINQIGQGRTLLILGEPGSGKTISLLKLAQRLIERTERGLNNQPIPVVFNLSSWAKRRQAIMEWLIKELREKYQVPESLGKRWIEQEQLILLLDGLDEVKEEHRNACVRALNQFIDTHGTTEIVICSRIKDYEALTERLQLSSAICIQPTSPKQVYEFLENASDSLAGLKTLLQQDAELEKFAETPLILNIMSLTYQGWSVEQLLQQFRSTQNRYQHLFNAYIKRMLQRRGASSEYPNEKVIHWLSWLAKRMVQESQTVFLIEKMQPSWLHSQSERRTYRIMTFLLGALIIGLTNGLISGLISQLIIGLIIGLINGLISGLIVGLLREITLFEQISWSWQKAKSKLIFALIGSLISGFISGLISELILFGLIVGSTLR